MRHGDYAWIALAAMILGYELAAPSGQLLSQRMDAYRTRHPIATHLGIAYLALHLTRWWPAPIDPLHRLANRLGK
jgi:hypothetical protein